MSKNLKKIIVKNKKKITSGVIIISVITIISLILCLHVLPAVTNNMRKERIISIFKSLKLDDQKYILMNEMGKDTATTMDWNISKDSSYTRTYVRQLEVNTTTIEINKLAIDAGWTYIGEPYTIDPIFHFNPNTTFASHSYNYKTNNNEYVKISTFSKLRMDALYNKPNMTQDELIKLDESINSAPTEMLISVNLDSNN
ncbi:MAG: hypothetical protein WCH58_03590 [Candidatus Saccharibacteria bacterium]